VSAGVEVRGVRKSYGAAQVLDGVDLSVPGGGRAVLIGPSGAGKSTLLRVINHLEKPDAGFVRVDGDLMGVRTHRHRLRELSERAILRQRARIGFVFQDFHLFPHLSAADNVIEGVVAAHGATSRPRSAEARRSALGHLARVGLTAKADAYPRQMSGGEQQRVAIARALALDPRLILMDEPTSSLDPELVHEVREVIRDRATAGTTMIVATHEIGFAREIADLVVFMENGRIVEQGPPREVLEAPRQERTRRFLSRVM
jgi:polar amino acid transport system ATP-binding protein